MMFFWNIAKPVGVPYPEVEHAFDVPVGTSKYGLFHTLEGILALDGWTITASQSTHRRITYYDSPDLLFFYSQKTQRVIDGFRWPNFIRTDLKSGSKEDRRETNYFSTLPPTPDQLLGFAKLLDPGISEIVEAVHAEADHNKIVIEKYVKGRRIEVEVKLDEFNVENGLFYFNELELEHVRPRDPKGKVQKAVQGLVDLIAQMTGYELVIPQKYTRALQGILPQLDLPPSGLLITTSK